MSNINNLFERKKSLLNDLEKINNEINECELTTEEWLSCGDKLHYNYTTDLPSDLRNVIRKYCFMDRYSTVTIDDVIEQMECNECSEEEYEGFTKLAQKANFGSVHVDWQFLDDKNQAN